ncbi:MAG TPA: hypothetical protein VG796_10130 [Verrucomicrobiales bacterium]|nr:hypothetical protein [Verrucomicrobiales bacterium]
MKTGVVRGLIASVITACLLCLSAHADSEKPTLPEQFDKILRFPGDYRQNCNFATSSYPAPLPAFRSIMQSDAGISEANIKFLRENRAGVIPILTKKLETADLLRKPVPQPRDPSGKQDPEGPDPIGVDPDSFNTHLLTIIEELDAVEVIPQLLAIEEKYVPMLHAFEKDPAAPVPQVDGADRAKVVAENLSVYDKETESLRKEPEAELERKRAIFRAQAVQRDLLATCVLLMRNAGYAPLRSSRLEKLYGEILQTHFGKDKTLSKYKSPDDIPDYSRSYIKFDPVHKLAWRENIDLGIPYTPELRKEIIDLTKSFVASRNAAKTKEQ